MEIVICEYLALAGMLLVVQGKTFRIKTDVINGNLVFTWTNAYTHGNDIQITKDGNAGGWIKTANDSYTVQNVLMWKTIQILLRQYRSSDLQQYDNYKANFTVESAASTSGVSRVNKDVSSLWESDLTSGVPRVNEDVSSSRKPYPTSGVPGDLPNSSQKTNYTPIVIGVSFALFILSVIVTVAITIYLRRRKSKQQQHNHKWMSDTNRTGDSLQPDVAEYATVDESLMLRNSKQADRMADDAVENKDVDDEDTKNLNPIHATNVETNESNFVMTTKKCGMRTSQDGEEKTTGTSNDKKGSKTVNQDGLVYIDVAFAKKPESPDANVKSVLHGEEGKTEYTFVDFSKKASPMQEIKDNVNTD